MKQANRSLPHAQRWGNRSWKAEEAGCAQVPTRVFDPAQAARLVANMLEDALNEGICQAGESGGF